MAKATLQYYEGDGPRLNTTQEQAPAIMATLMAFKVAFTTSYFDRIGHPDKMQIILRGDDLDEKKAFAALRKEGLLETDAEKEERLEKLMQGTR